MNRTQWLAVAMLMIGMAGKANAQPAVPTGPTSRPTVSPYLNLLRGGNSAAFNYFSLVRPGQNALRNFRSLQAGVANNQSAINSVIGNGQIGSTGVPTQFMNYGAYFMNSGMIGQGTGGGSSASGRSPAAGRNTAGAATRRR